jgi:hypothetical protein
VIEETVVVVEIVVATMTAVENGNDARRFDDAMVAARAPG